MGRKRVRPLGQITFKLPPERHQTLLSVAAVFDTDISGLMSQLVVENLPSLLQRAKELKEQEAAAKEAFEALTMTVDIPEEAKHLVLLAMDEGRKVDPPSRIFTIIEAIKPHAKGLTPAVLITIANAALHALQREDEKNEIKERVAGMMAEIDELIQEKSK